MNDRKKNVLNQIQTSISVSMDQLPMSYKITLHDENYDNGFRIQ